MDIDEKQFFIGRIDGADCKTLTDFIFKLKEIFHFPDYFGGNMDSVWDCIRDLEWIDKPNYALVIYSFDRFLIGEKPETKASILDFLNEVKTDWASVPNYEGEAEYRSRSRFEVIYIDN